MDAGNGAVEQSTGSDLRQTQAQFCRIKAISGKDLRPDVDLDALLLARSVKIALLVFQRYTLGLCVVPLVSICTL